MINRYLEYHFYLAIVLEPVAACRSDGHVKPPTVVVLINRRILFTAYDSAYYHWFKTVVVNSFFTMLYWLLSSDSIL